MKSIRSRCLAAGLSLLLALSLVLPASAAEEISCSPWAEGYLSFAIDYEYLPQTLLDCDYTQTISRIEFAQLAYQTMAQITAHIQYYIDSDAADAMGEEASRDFIKEHGFSYPPMYPTCPENYTPYRDTQDTAVEALTYLGILQGKENRLFDPAASLTREEAATILTRMADHYSFHHFQAGDLSFTDWDQVSDWALDGVEVACNMGLMNGVSSTTFSPQGTYTREQAVATMVRLDGSKPYLNAKTHIGDGFYYRTNSYWKWVEDEEGQLVFQLPIHQLTYSYRPDDGYDTIDFFSRSGTWYVVANGRDSAEEPWSQVFFDLVTGERLFSFPDPRGSFYQLSTDQMHFINYTVDSYDEAHYPWGRDHYFVYDWSGNLVMDTYDWHDLYEAGYVSQEQAHL